MSEASPSKLEKYIRLNIGEKYMEWQAELLQGEFNDKRGLEYKGKFKASELDYRELFSKLKEIEMDYTVQQMFEEKYQITSALLKYKPAMSMSVRKELIKECENCINHEIEEELLKFMESIPKKAKESKDYGNQVFTEFIALSERLEKEFGVGEKIILETKVGVKEDEEEVLEEKKPAEDSTAVGTDEAGSSTINRKERKGKIVEKSEKEIYRVEMRGVRRTMEMLLYTMLSKLRIWSKLMKTVVSNSSKKNRIEYISWWYKGYKKDHKKYIVMDGCPYMLELKDFRVMRKRIYEEYENNGELFTKVEEKKYDEVKKMLDDGLYSVNDRNGVRRFKGMLHLAAIHNDMKLVDLLEPYHPDVDLRDKYLMTPLYYAIEHKHYEMIERLLKMGADVEAKDEHNATPFYWGVYCANLKILKLLVEYGAQTSVICMMNRNSLIKAAFMNKYDIVEYLLTFPKVRDNIDDCDDRGRTALHAACWGAKGGREGKWLAGEQVPDSKESLILLLDAGADVRTDFTPG